MLHTISQLSKARLLSPAGLFHLSSAIGSSGINLSALLHYAAHRFPHRPALTYEQHTDTWSQLYATASHQAGYLHRYHRLSRGSKVALVSANSANFVTALFAIARTGADIYLPAPGMSTAQFAAFLTRHHIDLVVYDIPAAKVATGHPADTLPLESLAAASAPIHTPPPRIKGGRLIVLTAATTGEAKTAGRKPSATKFLHPLSCLLARTNINTCASVLIATPMHHGFGLAALLMSVVLGKHIVLMPRFDAVHAAALIERHKIEAAVLVPLMLKRLHDAHLPALGSLRCILSGGAALPPALAAGTIDALGPILYNLYGTSEAGFCIMATPADLRLHPGTIGRALYGVSIHINATTSIGIRNQPAGNLLVHCSWASVINQWTDTGDIAYRDEDGYYYLCGRSDDMIISGGENVYPIELENILSHHPAIAEVAVTGIDDEVFGERLRAFVVLCNGTELTETELEAWLRIHAAPHQVPASIVFLNQLPYTPLGKPDKKQLRLLPVT